MQQQAVLSVFSPDKRLTFLNDHQPLIISKDLYFDICQNKTTYIPGNEADKPLFV